MGWAYQILPYLEEGAVHSISTQAELNRIFVSMYLCPSRRQKSLSADGTYLMDYAGIQPSVVKENENQFWGCPNCIFERIGE